MKGFQHHESCPRCNSRDNLARYSDGSGWCFGCGLFEKATTSAYVINDLHQRRGGAPSELSDNPSPPEDADTSFSEESVRWLGTFHLDVPTAIRRGVLYSPSKNQIIYQLGNVWQARNLVLGPGNSGRPRSKNFTSGNVNECTHIYGSNRNASPDSGPSLGSHDLVIVEDPVSAIRVAALRDSMPLLGSHLATSRLNAVAGLYKALVVWLDSDKLIEARKIAERAKLIGIQARVIWTELDPKCYTDAQIEEILK